MRTDSKDISMADAPAPTSMEIDPHNHSSNNQNGTPAIDIWEDSKQKLAKTKSDCKALHNHINELIQWRRSHNPDDGDMDTLRKLLTQGSLLMLNLKQSNRELSLRTDDCFEESMKQKRKADEVQFQLQNLFYEAQHYRKEIQRCKNFASRDATLDLVPLHEFKEKAPKELASATDDHQLMLNRLHFELAERERLKAELQELNGRKRAIVDNNNSKKNFLKSLPAQVKNIKNATLPLQEYMKFPAAQQDLMQDLARQLPTSLYILYCTFVSYRDNFDNTITVTIEGTVESAQTFWKDHVAQQQGDSTEDIDRDAKRSKKPEQAAADQLQQQSKESSLIDTKRLLEVFPLAVVVEIPIPGSGRKNVLVKFRALLDLNIITVTCTSGNESVLLKNIFPDDSGAVSPNPANVLLTKSPISFDNFEYGRPYKWAQWIAGLDFLDSKVLYQQQHEAAAPSSSSSSSSTGTTPSPMAIDEAYSRDYKAIHREKDGHSIQAIIKAIQFRIRANDALVTQLKNLDPSSATSATTNNLNVRLLKLKEIDANEQHQQLNKLFSSASSVVAPPNNETIRYLAATLERDGVQLECNIAISEEYPVVPPSFFNLRFVQSGNQEQSRNVPDELLSLVPDSTALGLVDPAQEIDTVLLDIEDEVNLYFGDEKPNGAAADNDDDQQQFMILTNQINKLMVCIGVYFECNRTALAERYPSLANKTTATAQQHHHQQERKICIRPTRGTDRRLPFVYDTLFGLFDQRKQ